MILVSSITFMKFCLLMRFSYKIYVVFATGLLKFFVQVMIFFQFNAFLRQQPTFSLMQVILTKKMCLFSSFVCRWEAFGPS